MSKPTLAILFTPLYLNYKFSFKCFEISININSLTFEVTSFKNTMDAFKTFNFFMVIHQQTCLAFSTCQGSIQRRKGLETFAERRRLQLRILQYLGTYFARTIDWGLI
jgi:hypothetical protein